MLLRLFVATATLLFYGGGNIGHETIMCKIRHAVGHVKLGGLPKHPSAECDMSRGMVDFVHHRSMAEVFAGIEKAVAVVAEAASACSTIPDNMPCWYNRDREQ